MKGQGKTLLFMVCIGMELSTLYACTNFLTLAIFNRTFPFPEAVASFVLAAVLTRFTQGKGWRVIYVLGVQALGFIPALLAMHKVFNAWTDSFLSQPWFMKYYDNPTGALGWFVAFLLVLWAFVFWRGGTGLAKRATDYFTICSRFDRGLFAFFLLFLTKFLLRTRGGFEIKDPTSEFLVFSFLIFGLLAIGLARNRSHIPKDFLPGYQGIGVILSFTTIILLVGTGLVLFCLPYLTLVAEKGYDILKIAAGPVGYVLLKILIFIFGYHVPQPERPQPQKEIVLPDLTSQSRSSEWMELLGKILAYGIWALLGIVLMMIVGVTLFLLFRWLFSKTPVSQERQSSWYLIGLWTERLRRFLYSCWSWLVRRVKGHKGVIQLYIALLIWGRHSGLAHSLSETPKEYGLRLKHRFPILTREIELIVESFNEVVYGQINLSEHQLAMTQTAWCRLRSPRHWPSRFRNWFLRSSDRNVS
jgi:hypothetical protein